MWSSAAVAHLLQGSTYSLFRDGILHTLLLTSGYLSYCYLSIISNQSAHSPLTSTRHLFISFSLFSFSLFTFLVLQLNENQKCCLSIQLKCVFLTFDFISVHLYFKQQMFL